MKITPLTLPGTYEITLTPIADERGYFVVTYEARAFTQHGLVTAWVQENQSLSRRGVVRGLHFQLPPHSETKLVRVLAGAVLDVFVDLRKGSPTYGRWDSCELSAARHNMIYLPRGFAHGFCALTDEAIMAYKVDAYYAPEAAGGIRWNDPDIGIAWPVEHPTLSPRDAALPLLRDFASPFEWEG
ncbi:MAG: dTDP-4-dehydrorhamnose 3,5-epimerase [Anaerolineae bacterium]